MWSAAWHAFLQRPVSGYGAGQYFLVAQDKFRPFNHPHDIVLQVLFQWGAVGAICYFSLAALVGLRAALALRDADVADLPAFLAGAALVTTSLYDGGLFNTYPTMMIAFALASIIAPRREPA